MTVREGATLRIAAEGRTLFDAAVELTMEGRSQEHRMSRVQGFRKAGCKHLPAFTGGGPSSCAEPRLTWVSTMLGNVRRSSIGTDEAIDAMHLPQYLLAFSASINSSMVSIDLAIRCCSFLDSIRIQCAPDKTETWKSVTQQSEHIACVPFRLLPQSKGT